MENTTLRFDLFEVIRIGLRWKKFIIGLTLLACLTAAIYFFLQKNTYKAYGSFFPSSAVMSGRINLFRENQQEWIDMFGGENEVDRAYVIANSANVISYLIGKFHIAAHYKIDTVNDKDADKKTYKKFTKNFIVSRSGYKHIEINFNDEDPELAYQVVNEAMNRTEDLLRDLYKTINVQLALAIDNRADSIQQQLTVYTDSLVNMRVRYNIYDLIAPGRKSQNYTPRSSGADYARGLEEIQNVEEVKDKLSMDKAKYLSLSNEFKTAASKVFPMIHVVQWASPNGPKAGPFRTLGVLTTGVIAFIFSLLLAVLIEYFRRNKDQFTA